MKYRRVLIPGGTFFFTLVTYKRQPLLCLPSNVDLLRQVIRDIKLRHPFQIDAFVLLPDHLHCIWTLPREDLDYAKRWRLIKANFSRGCKMPNANEISHSRQKKQEKPVWQRRYWEHMIRDEYDLTAHMEYVHFNPVKHGWASAPIDWPYSSFGRQVKQGIYPAEWGAQGDVVFDKVVGNE